jgi:anti-anti-sigma factor
MADSPEYTAQSPIVRMDISNRVVLTPESSITFENCQVIEKAVNDAIQENKMDIILDCKHVDLMDSAALEFFIQTHKDLNDRGGSLKVIGLNDVCHDILLVTRVINELFVFKDIQEAIKNSL